MEEDQKEMEVDQKEMEVDQKETGGLSNTTHSPALNSLRT